MLKTRDRHREIYHKEREREGGWGGERERRSVWNPRKKERGFQSPLEFLHLWVYRDVIGEKLMHVSFKS
jgi:hypothetical protein